MSATEFIPPAKNLPAPAAVLELFKPVTWFAPMWAFACGVISAGGPGAGRWAYVLGGVILAGPLACAASQAVNDWFDRHVDAINEPGRPIPSGRIPGRWGLYIALFWTATSVVLGAVLGLYAFIASLVAAALAWAYSAPPFRLKRNGWLGAAAVGVSYEGVAWVTGAAVAVHKAPSSLILALAALYSIGAHGIMTLNDFKAIDGDTRTGVRSLPVMLGPRRAALVACAVMIAPQLVVIGLLAAVGRPWFAAGIAGLALAQCALMPTLLADPKAKAPWYNGTGVLLFVLGMMASAFAVRGMG
ncbi:MAG: chlorophyll synthase ChlG [Alphaproteobacteria bacterium]|nr:chlorophyll synthase ChlG [Alphaproteobacteria bacterium]